jgi:hypothetical protein
VTDLACPDCGNSNPQRLQLIGYHPVEWSIRETGPGRVVTDALTWAVDFEAPAASYRLLCADCAGEHELPTDLRVERRRGPLLH